MRHWIAPLWGDRGGRTEHEKAVAKLRMGDGERLVAPYSALPKHHIKIERAGAPALPPPFAAKAALDLLEQRQQRARTLRACRHGGCIGVAPLRGPKRRAVDDQRNRFEFKPGGLERDQRGAKHCAGRTEPHVALVRAERDQIARQIQISCARRA